MECLIRLETPDKTAAKMELVAMTSKLMPAGKPLLAETAKYPKIADLIVQHGNKSMMKVLLLMVTDFCNSVNVVRNMNEDQQIEAAAMMLDECGNFRLEDYQIMFAMGKRGQMTKVRLMDRVDIQFISAMMDEFWNIRNRAGKAKEAEDTWTPPENPVPAEKVTEVFKEFSEQIRQQVIRDAMHHSHEDTKKIRKNLDEVIKDLKILLGPPTEDKK